MIRTITIFKHTFLFLLAASAMQAQVWEQKAGLPGSGRHHPVTFSIGNYGYLLTGSVNSSLASKDFYRYDADADSWQQMTDFPGPARSLSIGDAFNGKAYMGFGMTATGIMLNDLWSYDTATEAWTALASCPCPGRKHPTFSINEAEGKIYMGKGDNGQQNFADWWEYDIATDQWTQKTNFPSFARHHPFHFSIGDYTYSGLGHGPSIYGDLYRYDPSDDTWQRMANAPGVRVAGTQFSYGGYGFVLSGDGSGHQPTSPSAFWGYNPSADAWISLPPHPGSSRWAPGSFIIDGTLYFTSGQTGTNPNTQLESDLWSYDLQTALSSEEHDQLAFSLYPNPTTGLVYLDSPQPLDQGRVKIYSIDGRMVFDQPADENISMETLPPGVYILEVNLGPEDTGRVRVVKE